MLAILCTLVFAGAAALSLAVLYSSWQRHGVPAIAIVRAARSVADQREFMVRVMTPATDRMVEPWPQLRRQPRRLVTRVAVRSAELQRAAA